MIMIFSIGSLHLRGDLERLEGPGGRVRHRRVPRGRAEAVQGNRAFRPGPRCTPRPGRGPPAGTLPVSVCEFFIEIRSCSRLLITAPIFKGTK